MIACWLLADSAKLGFFIMKEQPVQFVGTAVFQIIFDSLILLQFHMYKDKQVELSLN